MKKEASPLMMVVLVIVVVAAIGIAYKFGIQPMFGIGLSDKPEPMPANVAKEFAERMSRAGGAPKGATAPNSAGGPAPVAPAPGTSP